MVKFLRRAWNRYSKLGRKRKKKQVWRRPTGRDNKMRERRRGYPARVQIGYKKQLEDKTTIMIYTLNDLKQVKKNNIVILGNVGKKKQLEIAKEALKQKIKLENLNTEKFLKENKKKSSKKETKEKKK
jgi:large subunit ribosomal protein L32e